MLLVILRERSDRRISERQPGVTTNCRVLSPLWERIEGYHLHPNLPPERAKGLFSEQPFGCAQDKLREAISPYPHMRLLRAYGPRNDDR